MWLLSQESKESKEQQEKAVNQHINSVASIGQLIHTNLDQCIIIYLFPLHMYYLVDQYGV